MLVCAGSATAAAQSFKVDWENQRLSIAAEKAPLADVLREVVRQTGSTVVGIEKASGSVTVDIQKADLRDAFRTLLAGVSYIMSIELPVAVIPATGPVAQFATNATNAENGRILVWLSGPLRLAVAQPCVASTAAARRSPCDDVASQVDVARKTTSLASAAEGARFRPSPAEAETARLVEAGFFKPDAPEGSLLAAAKAADSGVRIRALQTLALQNTKAGALALTDALDDENPFVRAEALEMLIHLGGPHPEVVRRLTDLLAHHDPAVRFPAATALGEQSGPEAEFQLKRALQDDDGAVRTMAQQLLQQKERQKETKKP